MKNRYRSETYPVPNNLKELILTVESFAEKYGVDIDNVDIEVSGDYDWGYTLDLSCYSPETEADREAERVQIRLNLDYKRQQLEQLKRELGEK